MATLVLTAVGSVFGPVGGAIGALIGQSIDARIFKPKGRDGPRLQDLRVQTSSYGAPIPKLFGALRVAGTLIWATDLVEHRSRKGGGKGRPSTTTYSYSASFAVLLSGRPIRAVHRIWADGNLLRGAAGDWKSETGFRLHPGDQDQAADPFIASAEGGESTPAYRGCAYAVFENMALEAFGNRIPSLTFEVEADAGPAPLGPMLEELSGGLIAGAGGPPLRGFAAAGDTVRGLVEMLDEALPVRLRSAGSQLVLSRDDEAPLPIAASELSEERREVLPGRGEQPGSVVLGYYDPARDYQAGVQQARRPGGRSARRIDLPAALAADEARLVAEDALARAVRERGSRSIRCGWSRLAVAPGSIVALPDDAGLWRVAGRAVERQGVKLELVRFRAGSAALPPAESGRSVTPPDRVHGPTVLHLLDLPGLEDQPLQKPRLLIAAAGVSPGWRRATLMASLNGGASWEPIGSTAAPAVSGTALEALPPAGEALLDLDSGLDVQLLHGGMELEDADDGRLLGGANLALIGRELVQFGRAEPLGGNRWRLSRLLRARRGTDWAAAGHQAGDRFVLIEPESLASYGPPLGALGAPVRVLASGIGDPVPVEASADNIGEALRPLAPVHLRARLQDDGGMIVTWVRRSRLGWAWLDGVEVPLGEDRERYRLGVTRADGQMRLYDLDSPAFVYDAAAVAADRDAGPEVRLAVVQVGSSAVSRPAELPLVL